jgi:hypothetical protein
MVKKDLDYSTAFCADFYSSNMHQSIVNDEVVREGWGDREKGRGEGRGERDFDNGASCIVQTLQSFVKTRD